MRHQWPKFRNTTEEWLYFRYGLDMTKVPIKSSTRKDKNGKLIFPTLVPRKKTK